MKKPLLSDMQLDNGPEGYNRLTELLLQKSFRFKGLRSFGSKVLSSSGVSGDIGERVDAEDKQKPINEATSVCHKTGTRKASLFF